MSEGDEIRFWPIGRVVSYYSNGKQKSELTFNRDNGWADPLSGLLILNYWDESGKQLVNEGNGNCRCELMPYSFNSLIEIGYVENGLRNSWWKIESTDGSVREELYEKGDFKKGIIKEKNGSLYSYVNFEQISQPVGGMAKFYAVISKSLRYPKEARRNRIEGKVFVQFIIERDGTISNPKVIKGLGFGCDEAAIKAIQKSPKWIPGTQRGKPVTQRYTLPIQFKLG
jgi:TonB family protein